MKVNLVFRQFLGNSPNGCRTDVPLGHRELFCNRPVTTLQQLNLYLQSIYGMDIGSDEQSILGNARTPETS
ncbi:hypothetical protein J6590_049625 [Homalodisca vitripennis]|nr:hypothetical protein J6590_049625 [Homalodisca vitripennis]